MTKPIEIAVISGKGGTGKTVLASSLAAVTESKVIADCDVDAPDLHLLLNPTIVKQEAFPGAKVASIDPRSCTLCGRCLEVCRFGAIEHQVARAGQVYTVDHLACEGCGVCAWVCPAEAVGLQDSPGGRWYVSETRFGPMVHASLGIAQENSGKLVTIVRREARKAAIDAGLRFVLIDGPPGIGCPVIASIAGTSLAIVVAEPTRCGVHDLERVLKLTGHFGLRTAAVINKCDLNVGISRDIRKLLAECGILLIGEIPFTPEANRAIAAGQVLVEFSDGDVARQLRQIGTEMMRLLCGNAEAEIPSRDGIGQNNIKGA